MAMNGFTKDMNIIQQLNDEPNDRDGLTAGELKAKFDEGGLALKDYLNNTVKPYVEGMEGTEAAHEADTVRHITAAERTAWNGKYDKTGGVLSGNVTVQPSGTPNLTLNAPAQEGTGRSRTVLQKNASGSVDYGTQLVDYVWGDGSTANQRTTLRLQCAAALAERLMLIDYAAGGSYVQYHLYGEHNPPGMGSVTGLTAALDGKVDKVTGKGLSTNDYTNAEKNKLAGIAAGAQVNSITGVKGNAETNYRTGNVNLTPANIGAAAASHSHDAGDITGTLAAARLPAATASTQGAVKLGASGGAAAYSHTHNIADVTGLQDALDGKSDTGHTHNYLPLSGGTLTGDVTVQKNIPRVTFATGEKANVGRARMILYKNANTTADSGTQLADYSYGDGGITTNRNVRLTLRAAVTDISSLLTLAFNEGEGGSTVSYKLYGEHNKPSAEDIVDGILPTARGGTGNSTGYVTAGQKSGETLGNKATAEGRDTIAFGDGSHAEGYKTFASGNYSHAEGYGTYAAGQFQHVFGIYNVGDISSTEIVGSGTGENDRKNIRTLSHTGNEWIAGTLTQASDARLKDVGGEVPDVSGIRAVRFKWNDVNGEHDEKDHIGYIAQEVEAVAPYLVGEDSNGYKSLDYIALLCAKVETLERQVRDLTEKLEGGD